MSQNDIDVLFDSAAENAAQEDKAEVFLKKLQPIVERALDSMTSILSAFIGKECKLIAFEVVPTRAGELAAMVSGSDIVFESAIEFDQEYPAFLILEQDAAKKSANMMTGQPADYELDQPLGDERKAAAYEIMSKIFGGISDVLLGRNKSESDIAIARVEAITENQVSKIEGSLAEEFYLVSVTMDLDSGESWHYQVVLGKDLAENIVSALGEDEPPPAPKQVVAATPLEDAVSPAEPQPDISAAPAAAPPQPSSVPPPSAREPEVTYQPAQFQELPERTASYEARNMDVLLDVPLNITVVLGRSKVPVKQVLEYGQGSLITLDKLAGEPVDLVINGKYFAKGEVVVIDENFGVRISAILSPEERIQALTLSQMD